MVHTLKGTVRVGDRLIEVDPEAICATWATGRKTSPARSPSARGWS